MYRMAAYHLRSPTHKGHCIFPLLEKLLPDTTLSNPADHRGSLANIRGVKPLLWTNSSRATELHAEGRVKRGVLNGPIAAATRKAPGGCRDRLFDEPSKGHSMSCPLASHVFHIVIRHRLHIVTCMRVRGLCCLRDCAGICRLNWRHWRRSRSAGARPV